MSNCENIKKLINQQIDNELNKSEQKQLEEHLHECNSCMTYHQNMIVIHNRLLSLPAIDTQISIVDQLISDIDNIDINKKVEKTKVFNKQWFKRYGLAIAAAIVLFVPITLTVNQNLNLTNNSDKSYASRAPQEEAAMNFGIKADNTNSIQETQDSEGNVEERGDFDGQMPLKAETFMPYIVEIENNQLIVYQNDEVIYKSKTWADNLNVDYYQVDENEIIYSLFSKDNDLIASYKINLLEKIEEKVEE